MMTRTEVSDSFLGGIEGVKKKAVMLGKHHYMFG